MRPDPYVPWEFELPMFAPVPGRAGVLYIADQDQDEALELYLGRLDRVRATPASNGALPRRGR